MDLLKGGRGEGINDSRIDLCTQQSLRVEPNRLRLRLLIVMASKFLSGGTIFFFNAGGSTSNTQLERARYGTF